MGNITLSLPDELQERMRKHTEIRWSEVVRRSIAEKIDRLESMEDIERIAKKSKLTKKDVRELSSLIKKETYEDLNKRFSST